MTGVLQQSASHHTAAPTPRTPSGTEALLRRVQTLEVHIKQLEELVTKLFGKTTEPYVVTVKASDAHEEGVAQSAGAASVQEPAASREGNRGEAQSPSRPTAHSDPMEVEVSRSADEDKQVQAQWDRQLPSSSQVPATSSRLEGSATAPSNRGAQQILNDMTDEQGMCTEELDSRGDAQPEEGLHLHAMAAQAILAQGQDGRPPGRVVPHALFNEMVDKLYNASHSGSEWGQIVLHFYDLLQRRGYSDEWVKQAVLISNRWSSQHGCPTTPWRSPKWSRWRDLAPLQPDQNEEKE